MQDFLPYLLNHAAEEVGQGFGRIYQDRYGMLRTEWRVLAHLGMVEADDGLTTVGIPARANRSVWVRSPRGGVAHFVRESGAAVRRGDVLGRVSGLLGEDAQDIISPLDGIIIGHATLPVVHQGDALFHIAALDHPERVGALIGSITDAILASEPEGSAQGLLDEDEVV